MLRSGGRRLNVELLGGQIVTQKYKAHPKNVPGPFYVVNGCCTACGVPDVLAPDLFAYDQDNHCFVKRQPATAADLESALDVIVGQELGCIRYHGSEDDVLRRLAEVGEANQCDVAPPPGIVPALRNHVTFDTPSPEVAALPAEALLNRFRGYMLQQRSAIKFQASTVLKNSSDQASFSVSWVQGHAHDVIACRLDLHESKFLIRHSDHIGLSREIDEWLKQEGCFSNVRWYSERDWYGGKRWRARPW